MTVDPEQFSAQINYLSAIGRMIVPRAFAFEERRVLFVGDGPFHSEDLGLLLSEGTEWHEYESQPSDFTADILVLGRDGYTKGKVRETIMTASRQHAAPAARFLPQEGLIDEILFGHDWWTEKRDDLKAMSGTHKGLQAARDLDLLAPIGVPLKTPSPPTSSKNPKTVPPSSGRKAIRSIRDTGAQVWDKIRHGVVEGGSGPSQRWRDAHLLETPSILHISSTEKLALSASMSL